MYSELVRGCRAILGFRQKRQGVMSQKFDGSFSSNFFSIQLQLKTLLEEAGGESASELLEAL